MSMPNISLATWLLRLEFLSSPNAVESLFSVISEWVNFKYILFTKIRPRNPQKTAKRGLNESFK